MIEPIKPVDKDDNLTLLIAMTGFHCLSYRCVVLLFKVSAGKLEFKMSFLNQVDVPLHYYYYA